MGAKPFRTIQEQVDLLQARGMKVDEKTPEVLMREGYYSIVNGYKDPFIDAERTAQAGEDRYVEGSKFSDLCALYTFDRELRSLTFMYLILAEAKVKTAVAYTFSEAHRSPNDYLLQSSFCSEQEFVPTSDGTEYAKEVSGLTGILGRRAEKSDSGFVSHYRDTYGPVPLWVLVNDLTFGNIEHFFNLMKPAEQRGVCKMIVASTGRTGSKRLGYFDEKKAIVSIETLVKFRNVCAHDERLYCARVGGRKSVNYIKMVWMLERYLTPAEFSSFIRDLTTLLTRYVKAYAIKHVLKEIGFVELLKRSEDGTLFEA